MTNTDLSSFHYPRTIEQADSEAIGAAIKEAMGQEGGNAPVRLSNRPPLGHIERFCQEEWEIMESGPGTAVDYTMENDGSMDIWGWCDATPEDESEWRIKIILADSIDARPEEGGS